MNTNETQMPLSGGGLKRVSFKAWLIYEAALACVSENAIFMRLQRGKYKGLHRRKRNHQAFDVLVSADLAAAIEPNGSGSRVSAPVLHVKRQLPVSRVKLCECGLPAVKRSKGSHVCLRCAEIESRLWLDFTSRTDGVSSRGGLLEHRLCLDIV